MFCHPASIQFSVSSAPTSQEFVRGAEDFEGQIERFGVALATDKLIRENPDVFNGRAAGEILNLVAAMQSGSETMGEASDEFLVLLNRVVNVRNSLQAFADSDLLTDYTAMSGETSLENALATVNQGILDAITNGGRLGVEFDVNIGYSKLHLLGRSEVWSLCRFPC